MIIVFVFLLIIFIAFFAAIISEEIAEFNNKKNEYCKMERGGKQ